jgi:trans-2,3-dihydro-3-hydroxyanthranilate isomerase
MSYRYYIADVFTDKAFGGNQLAVVTDARGLDGARMAAIAREFNFSETVFFLPPDDPSNTRKVRIFTPGRELPFAGHPTIGAAHVLAASGGIELNDGETRIVLEEGVGPIPVTIQSRDGRPAFIRLTSAKIPERGSESFDAAMIARILSLDVSDIDLSAGRAIEPWSAGVPYLFVPLASLDALGRARIDRAEWEAGLMGSTWSEIYLFADDAPHEGRDGSFRARMYAPTLGIAEDPATGSAAAAFGGYMTSRSSHRDGTLRYRIMQGVEMGRPSLIEVECDLSQGTLAAVHVGGTAVLVASGDLHVA